MAGSTFVFKVPVYIDWLDWRNHRHLTTGRQLDLAIQELLLAQSPWTDEWTTMVPYQAAGQHQLGHARLVNVTANHQTHQAILTVIYWLDDSVPVSDDFVDVLQIFLTTLLNRFCQRTVFGVAQARLTVRFAGLVSLAGQRIVI